MKNCRSEIPSKAAVPFACVNSSSGSSIVVRICHQYAILDRERIPIHLTRRSTASDLAWIAPLLATAPEAAQWLPESDPVLVVEGCGLLAYRGVAPDEYEILNLAVAPEHRRQGVARALLQAALALGGSWFLEVRESNHLARMFYESMGFRAIGVRPGYYQAPPEKAIVMGWKR